jgi:2-oxoglutarate dehydrogenase E1 component
VPFVRDAVDELRRIYCGASGYDFAHVRDPKERLVLCSGKIFVEIVSSEAHEQDVGATAVVRIELLYPFPEDEIRTVVEGYPNLREVVWVQEEPKNAGAWSFVEPRLRELLGEELSLRYVGKPARPAPPQGSAGFHKREHERLVLSAFREGS